MKDDTRRKSLLERAPSDLQIAWRGVMGERWSIAISCTMISQDELRAVVQILETLNAASEPASGIEAATAGETSTEIEGSMRSTKARSAEAETPKCSLAKDHSGGGE